MKKSRSHKKRRGKSSSKPLKRNSRRAIKKDSRPELPPPMTASVEAYTREVRRDKHGRFNPRGKTRTRTTYYRGKGIRTSKGVIVSPDDTRIRPLLNVAGIDLRKMGEQILNAQRLRADYEKKFSRGSTSARRKARRAKAKRKGRKRRVSGRGVRH